MPRNYTFILLATLGLLSLASSSQYFQRDNSRVLAEAVPIASSDPLCEDVKIYVTKEQDRETSINIRLHLTSLKDSGKLLDFILGPKPKDDLLGDYLGPLIGFSAQWIVFFAIGIIVLIGCIAAFTYSYRNAKKRMAKGQEVAVGKGTKFFLIMSCVLLVFLLGADIATLAFSTRQVRSSKDKVACAVATFSDEIQLGRLDQHWVGTVNLRDRTLAAIAGISTTVPNLSYNTGATDISSVTGAYNTVSGAVTTFYNAHQSDTLNRADPTISATYAPTFIQNLGPASSATTESGQILAEMTSKKNRVVGAATNITGAIAALRAAAAAPAVSGPRLAHSAQVAREAAASVIITSDELKDYAEDFQHIVGKLEAAVIAITSIDLAFVIIALIAIGGFYGGIKWARKVIHVSWCLIGLMMVLTWVLATISWAATFAVNDVCRVAEGLLADAEVYNATADKFFNEEKNVYARNLLYVCLHGDGDILKALGGRDTLAPFEAMFWGLDFTANLTASLQTVPDSTVIPLKKFTLTQVNNGLISDSPLTNTDLAKLNARVNRASNTCTNVRDTWTLNSANCTSNAGTLFALASSANFNLGYTTCIGLDNWNNKASNARYNSATFPQPACGELDGKNANVGLANLVDGFADHRQKVSTLYTSISNDLDTLGTANSNYMTVVKSATANIAPVRTQTAAMYAILGADNGGILKNSYCTFLRDTFQVVEDQACVKMLPAVYRQTITLIVAGFMGLFALPFLFLLSKRLLQKRNREIYSQVNTSEKASPTITSPVTSP